MLHKINQYVSQITPSDKHYYKVNFILILLVLIILGIAVINGGYIHDLSNNDIKHEYYIRQETISLIDSDRKERKMAPIRISNKAQKKATAQAQKAYKVVSHQDKQSKYYIHNLHSNGHEVNPKRTAKISKKLQKHNKTKKHNYLENCAEIGFGKRYYRNPGFHWQPYHKVKTNMGLASLVNNHFMKYDQAKNNVHRKSILHKGISNMGIAVLYNHKTNHGVIVEEFHLRPEHYRVVR